MRFPESLHDSSLGGILGLYDEAGACEAAASGAVRLREVGRLAKGNDLW